MTDYLRNDKPQTRWQRERRADTAPGGRVPLEWQAQCVDLDSLLVEIDGEPHLVGVAGKLFVQWDKVPFRIWGIVETKNPGEAPGAYVTYQVARDAGYDGYCVTLFDEELIAERHDGEQRIFSSVPEFVKATHVLKRGAA